jgi:hypothetical protein
MGVDITMDEILFDMALDMQPHSGIIEMLW